MRRPCASNLLVNIPIRIGTVISQQSHKRGSGRNALRPRIRAS